MKPKGSFGHHCTADSRTVIITAQEPSSTTVTDYGAYLSKGCTEPRSPTNVEQSAPCFFPGRNGANTDVHSIRERIQPPSCYACCANSQLCIHAAVAVEILLFLASLFLSLAVGTSLVALEHRHLYSSMPDANSPVMSLALQRALEPFL